MMDNVMQNLIDELGQLASDFRAFESAVEFELLILRLELVRNALLKLF